MTLTNLQIGAQDPHLFEVPAGYAAMPAMGFGFGKSQGMSCTYSRRYCSLNAAASFWNARSTAFGGRRHQLGELARIGLVCSGDAEPGRVVALEGELGAFHQKWGADPLEASDEALDQVRAWIGISGDPAWDEKTRAQRWQRIEQRVATLTKSYTGAPKLLESARPVTSSDTWTPTDWADDLADDWTPTDWRAG